MALIKTRKCPYCGKKLIEYSAEYVGKHLARCANSASLRFYTGKGPGRPSKKDAQASKELRERIIEEMNKRPGTESHYEPILGI